MAEFRANDVKIQAELSTGHIITCITDLKAYGSYVEWHETGPCEWMYGWTESDYDIDEATIEPLYADEFDSNIDYKPGATIAKIIQILENPEWEVQDGWQDDREIA